MVKNADNFMFLNCWLVKFVKWFIFETSFLVSFISISIGKTSKKLIKSRSFVSMLFLVIVKYCWNSKSFVFDFLVSLIVKYLVILSCNFSKLQRHHRHCFWQLLIFQYCCNYFPNAVFFLTYCLWHIFLFYP